MSTRADTAPAQPARLQMSVFERYLTVWVFLCIVTGIALGQTLPALFQFFGRLEIARV
ncbi:MAG: arsenical-resistance protein, partial [Betaproteobacteria bacterium]|nr:arsenical-resistance protein [Betaproteobacteria bacterium]